MRLLKIRFIYPRKIDGEKKYKQSNGTVKVSLDTLDTFIGEINTIDCVCGIMKLVIMSKQKSDSTFKEEITRFFEDLDEFDDRVHNAVINFFAEENKTTNGVYELNDFKQASFELTKSFINIISSQ